MRQTNLQRYFSRLSELDGKLKATRPALTGIDERQDITNQLLLEVAGLLAEGLRIQVSAPSEEIEGLPGYELLEFRMDKARSYELVEKTGDTLTFATDAASLDGVAVKLDSPMNDDISASLFNPIHYTHKGGFKKFYLTSPQATGKTLSIFIGRAAGAEATASIIATVPQTSSKFTHGQTTVGTTEVALASSFPLRFGVVLKADDSNPGDVYVGNTGLTTSTGYRLDAGQGISLEVSDVALIYLIANASDQLVHYLGV
jgi:hypothetical protein